MATTEVSPDGPSLSLHDALRLDASKGPLIWVVVYRHAAVVEIAHQVRPPRQGVAHDRGQVGSPRQLGQGALHPGKEVFGDRPAALLPDLVALVRRPPADRFLDRIESRDALQRFLGDGALLGGVDVLELAPDGGDRKSVVEGKSVSVRVDPGG